MFRTSKILLITWKTQSKREILVFEKEYLPETFMIKSKMLTYVFILNLLDFINLAFKESFTQYIQKFQTRSFHQ